jgi:hypothetical protein
VQSVNAGLRLYVSINSFQSTACKEHMDNTDDDDNDDDDDTLVKHRQRHHTNGQSDIRCR